jgi:Transmembrane domain of unknown function (DUF3566)
MDDDLDDAADTTVTTASPSAASPTTSASGRTARKPATRKTGANGNGNGSNGNGNGNGRAAGSKSVVSNSVEDKSIESELAESESLESGPVGDNSVETALAETGLTETGSVEGESAEDASAESTSAESTPEPEDVSDVSATLFAMDDSATESAAANDSAGTYDAPETYDSAGSYDSADTLYSSDSFYSGDSGQTVGIPPQDGFNQDASSARSSWEEDRQEPAADTLATTADGVWSYELTESPFTPEPLLAAPPMPSELPYRPPSASARYVANLAKKPSFTPSSSSTSLADSTAETTAAPPTSAPPAQAFPRPSGSTATRPAAAKPKPKPAPKPKASVKRSGARQAHLTIARVEPWSVMKFSFAVSVVAFIILFVAVAVLYGVLSALGVFDSIQHLVSNVTSSSGQAGVNADKWFSASRILGYTVLLGGLNIVLITAVSTIGAVIYNLTSRLIGGVEVTLKEAD